MVFIKPIDPGRVRFGVQWTTTREERPKSTGTLKKYVKNACIFEDTIAASGVYNTSNTDLDKKINGRVQARSTDTSLERVEQVAHGVVKILKPRRYCVNTNP